MGGWWVVAPDMVCRTKGMSISILEALRHAVKGQGIRNGLRPGITTGLNL
jgi:hypothetical protein